MLMKLQLVYELQKLGLKVKQQYSLPLNYKEIAIDNAYRIDILVENKVIIRSEISFGTSSYSFCSN